MRSPIIPKDTPPEDLPKDLQVALSQLQIVKQDNPTLTQLLDLNFGALLSMLTVHQPGKRPIIKVEDFATIAGVSVHKIRRIASGDASKDGPKWRDAVLIIRAIHQIVQGEQHVS